MSRRSTWLGSTRRFVALAALVLVACATDDPLGPPDDGFGALRVERIAAIGDGYLAGVTDGALFRSAQEASIPALFARAVGQTEGFTQPLVGDPGFAVDAEEGGRLTLLGTRPLALERLPTGGPPLVSDPSRPFDNLAVPGALLSEVGSARSRGTSILGNPFYDVVLRDRGTALEQLAEIDPTLVLVGYGTADVLTFALAGGDSELAPGLPTPPNVFANLYAALLDQVLASADQVVVFTLPDPSRMPFVETVPPIVVDPRTGEPVRVITNVPVIDPETGEQATDEEGNPLFEPRAVTVPLLGPEGPLDADDRVILEALPILAEGRGIQRGILDGTGEPLPDRLVLDRSELASIEGAVQAYNETIRRLARERDLAIVDVRRFQVDLEATGVVTDEVRLDVDYPGGQGFGLDGARFTPKAYGALTNRLIDAVNERFGARIPHVRTAELPGVPLLDIAAP